MIGMIGRGEMPLTIESEFDNLISRLRQLWLVEHNEDGSHRSGVIESSGFGDVASGVVLGRTELGTGPVEAITVLPTGVQIGITRLGALVSGPGGFSAGSVVFHNGTTLAQDNANLFWDNTAKSLSIGGLVISANAITQGDSSEIAFLTGATGSETEKVRISATGNVGIGTSSPDVKLAVDGVIKLLGSSSGYIGLQGAAAAGSTTYTLPSADGTNDQVLTTNGSAILSWTDKAGGGGGGITSLGGQTGAAQTFTSDTNVTIASSSDNHTLGWSGQLAVSRGGTGRSSLTSGSFIIGAGTSAVQQSSVKYVAPGTNTISAAVAAMSNGDVFILDSGTYTQSETITIPAGISRITILGQGSSATIIAYSADVNGIVSSNIGTAGNRIIRATLDGFQMVRNTGGTTATAITLWMGGTYNATQDPKLTLNDISIQYGSARWLNGIRIIDSRVSTLSNIDIRLDASTRTGVGIQLESCMQTTVTRSYIMSVATGISLIKAADSHILESVKHGCEDCRINTTSINICATGINLGYKCFAAKISDVEIVAPTVASINEDISLGAENGGYHHISNVYFDVFHNGLNMVSMNRPGSVITNCIFHVAQQAGALVFGTQATLCSVHNSVFRGVGSGGFAGIHLIGASSKAVGNLFEGSLGPGADIHISGTGCLVALNMIDTSITDAGSGTVLDNNPVH